MDPSQRPGPLQELPLELFLLPPNPNIPTSVKQIRGNKRPLSPGGPSLFSPAKRRILNDEGIHFPEKTVKSLLPSLATSLVSPARFSHALAGPTTPARVLDFGLPKTLRGDPQKSTSSHTTAMDVTPGRKSSSSSNRLAPSPELNPRTVRPTQTFRSPDEPPHDDADFEDTPGPSLSAQPIGPSFVPRELPPSTDPRSVHFPGFFVFQDLQVAVYPPEVMETNEESQWDLRVDSDTQKENLPPRRKAKKAVTAPNGSELKASHDLFSPSMATPRKSKSINATPSKMAAWGSAELSSTMSRNMRRISSPYSTPQEGKKALRQTMKDEMDLGEDQIDDDE